MIVSWDELADLRATVAMVDGGFDPLHGGHVDYFEEAAGLGAPVLCNLASDDYVARKHAPLLPQAERAKLIDALRPISYVHPSATTTAAVLEQLAPRFYVKGSDWRARGLPEEERAICERLGIEIAYLDTVTGSSTAILERFVEQRRSLA